MWRKEKDHRSTTDQRGRERLSNFIAKREKKMRITKKQIKLRHG